MAYDRPPEAEAFAAILEAEYGYVWSGAPHPDAAIITEGYNRLDEVTRTAGSVPAVTPHDRELAKAAGQGDYQKPLAMKSQQVEGWFR